MTTAHLRILRLFAAITTGIIAAAPALFVAPAGAAPGDGGIVSTSPTLSLETLGGGESLSFAGQQGAVALTIPVPEGLTPTDLRATVQLPPNTQGATLTVVQDDETLSSVNVPLAERSGITLPLRGAEVVDNAVAVTLRSFLVLPTNLCVFDQTNQLTLLSPSVVFAGVEAIPTAVADFLPPVLQQLTIALPAAPTQAESDAAVALTSAVVAYYGEQTVDVVLEALSEGQPALSTPSAALERQIAIVERPESAVTLLGTVGVPALLLSGPAPDLINQTRLLTSDMSKLAVSSKAVAGPLRVSPQLPPDSTTLRDLGEPGASATALTDPQVSIGLDQTRLGRPTGDIRVHLEGSYTPLPPNYGGQVVVSVGDQVLERWATDASGTIDKMVEVPNRLLQRFTDLNVAVDAAGDTGGCGETGPITLNISGDSPVQSSPATPPVPPGFQSVPQTLMPQVQVGMTVGSFADTVRAVSIVEGVQRLSAIPLGTSVVPLETAASSKSPAILIAADNWDDPAIDLPITRSGNNPINLAGIDGNGEKTTLTLDPSVNFGSLQTVVDGNRTLLVATSTGAPGQLDSLLNWLGADDERWVRLNGNALVAVPDRDPVALSIDMDAPTTSSDDSEDRSLIRWIGGGVLVAIAIGVAVVVIRSRRREPGS
jgi:hypothetical protein